MQFLNPIWFFALAALSIPVIIHLWNVRPGKTLKVGSISLITEASKSSSRSFKLLDILLLLLRCLLLTMLAMLLAAPVWKKNVLAQKATGWVLIPKEIFKETYQKYKPTVDSLNRAGYEFHYFDKGFAKADLKVIKVDSSLKDTPTNSNYWSLVKQLESKVGDLPVRIFTQNGINHFMGSKPKVKLKGLWWQTYTAKDSVKKWIASATFTNDNNIRVTDGSSTPQGTTYKSTVLKSGGDAFHDVQAQNGQTQISLKNNSNTPVTVDTSILRIAIYTDKYQLDATYLDAALKAATEFYGTRATIKQYSRYTAIPKEQTWLFWLSEQPVKPELLKSCKNVFQYQNGKVADLNSWIEPGHITLTKSIVAKSKSGAVWTDGFGNVLLSLEGNVYKFYTRFNPSWSSLVWNDEFPKMMLKLLVQNVPSQPIARDSRILSNRQLQPEIIAQFMPQPYVTINKETDLSRYFWLALVVVFIAERILSHKTKTVSNG